VCIGGFLLTRLQLGLTVRSAQSGRSQYPITGISKTAFASYAAEDRPRVLDRIAAIRIATGLDVFMDCLSLDPSQQWQARLEEEISRRDVFMLFWSKWAAKSPWVEWEWRRALRQKELKGIQVHPLESWPKSPLPQELAPLHLGDPVMAVREAAIRGARVDT